MPEPHKFIVRKFSNNQDKRRYYPKIKEAHTKLSLLGNPDCPVLESVSLINTRMTKEQTLRLLLNSFYFHLSPYYLYGKQENMISSHLSVPHKHVKHSFQKSQTPSFSLSIVHKGKEGHL
jgi:hypothetical protein